MTFRLPLTLLCALVSTSIVVGAPPRRSPVAQELKPAAVARANTDSVYQQIRKNDDLNGAVASVDALILRRDAATFKFNKGEIYFLAPVEGRVTGAVFIGDLEMSLLPPTAVERRSLARFSWDAETPQRFTRMVMRFTDQTFDEIKQSPAVKMSTAGSQSSRARDAYHEIQTFLRDQIDYNLDLRTLSDLYAPGRPGFFISFPAGGRFDKLVYFLDPLSQPDTSPEQVALQSFSETEGGTWAAFHLAADYQGNSDLNAQDHRLYDISRHEITATIRGTRILAVDRVTLQTLAGGMRVLPFDLYATLRVSRVRDEQGTELSWVQENKDHDADFAVILPAPIAAGKTLKLTIEYDGVDALKDSGGGNFILLPRESWYPTNLGTGFGDRAIFEMTFSYPKDFIFVGVGALTGPEQLEGDLKIAKWSTGSTEMPVAGFNYGKFIKELLDKETSYGLEFYANKEVPDELKEFQLFLDELARDKVHMTGITGNVTTSSMGDTALNDTQNASRIYSAYFGKLPYTRIAITQQPDMSFGQGWPTLIYMPYTAFIDSTQRSQLLGPEAGSDKFFRYVGPHETSHQWWGNVIGWKSYRDQWMSEGFAEFSTSLYVQYVRKDMAKFHDFWEEQRKRITNAAPATKNVKPYTVGPVTQGSRLNSGKTPNVMQFLIYPKGAYILHMIRMMMFDHRGGGDARFREMMTDFVKTNYNKDVTTEDFKHAVEKHMTPQMDVDKNASMDWFFNAWVYGTDIPAYNLAYQTSASPDGKTLVTVHITQSGVSDDFKMMVPIYADFGKGWVRLGAAKMTGNASVDIPIPLPQAPKKVTLCALDDVLYTSLESSRK